MNRYLSKIIKLQNSKGYTENENVYLKRILRILLHHNVSRSGFREEDEKSIRLFRCLDSHLVLSTNKLKRNI